MNVKTEKLVVVEGAVLVLLFESAVRSPVYVPVASVERVNVSMVNGNVVLMDSVEEKLRLSIVDVSVVDCESVRSCDMVIVVLRGCVEVAERAFDTECPESETEKDLDGELRNSSFEDDAVCVSPLLLPSRVEVR